MLTWKITNSEMLSDFYLKLKEDNKETVRMHIFVLSRVVFSGLVCSLWSEIIYEMVKWNIHTAKHKSCAFIGLTERGGSRLSSPTSIQDSIFKTSEGWYSYVPEPFSWCLSVIFICHNATFVNHVFPFLRLSFGHYAVVFELKVIIQH